MRISDWSSDVCSSDLRLGVADLRRAGAVEAQRHQGASDAEARSAALSRAAGLHQAGRRSARSLFRHRDDGRGGQAPGPRSEEHTSELQSLMRISYAVFCLKKKKKKEVKLNSQQN